MKKSPIKQSSTRTSLMLISFVFTLGLLFLNTVMAENKVVFHAGFEVDEGEKLPPNIAKGEIVNVDPFKGKQCLEVKGNGGLCYKVIEFVPYKFKPDIRYKISLAFKKGFHVDVSKCYVSVDNLRMSDNKRDHLAVIGIEASGPRDEKWHFAQKEFTAAEVNSIFINVVNYDSSESIWVDEITLEEVDDQAN